MADASRHLDFTHHPDAAEIRERHERILAGPQAVLVDGLLLLAGLYLAISPWVVTPFPTAAGGGLSRLGVINLIVGIAVAIVGLSLVAAPERCHRLSWTVVAMGVWMLVTPWVIGPSTTAVLWNNLWTGGVITALGLAATGMLAAGARTTRHTTAAAPAQRHMAAH
ncbi:SPW repeat protein [Nocardia veterana]|uniref:SPW repeat protein n=1 Tax=Nocardia veterana TaxID=132249 RepID=A0A7X6M3E1_9NOCA|nr:SPW repeat protein [Nocardia veterana]NKY88600.1 SPW repeat protein [Nocardia veterana]